MKIAGIVLLTGMVLFGLAAFGQVTEQEPNESPVQAMSIGTFGELAATVTVSGAMGYAGDSDWYRFEITASAAELILSTSTEDTSDLQVVLYSADVAPIEASENELQVTLATGSYLLRIASSELRLLSYELVISSALEHEPNDGVCIPNEIGVIGSEIVRMYASIEPVGDADFFAFEVAEGSEGVVQLRTDGTSGDTLLVLYRFDGELERYVPVARDDDSGAHGWSMIFSELDPGKYIARIHDYGDNETIGAYRFSAVQMVVEECEPNNTAVDACELGSLDLGGLLEADDLLSGGDIDFFEITVNAAGVLIVETSGPVGADSYICLRDASDISLGCDDDGGSGMWSRILKPVDAGRYFVTVEGYGTEDSFRYSLTAHLEQFASISEIEANNNPLTSTAVETLPAIAGGEITQNDVDFYTFAVPSATRVVVEVTGQDGADSYLCLYDSSENLITCDDDGGSGLWSRIDDVLEAGTYSVAVEGYNDTETFSYDLLIFLPEFAGP
ncbi:PPC domain-containing protein [Candidatus Bipolaricaulota bacterium]|nr:PPC domain-containing protein [Candidatus Bipolaricaulota bacterium]